MLTKNSNDNEFKANVLDIDDPEIEIGGNKAPVNKKAIVFVLFILFLLIGLFLLFSKKDSSKEEEKEVKKPVKKMVVPLKEQPRFSIFDDKPPPNLNAENNSVSTELMKKRQLDVFVSKNLSDKKTDEISIKKMYGPNFSNSINPSEQENLSDYLIKRRSSSTGAQSTLMMPDLNKNELNSNNKGQSLTELDLSKQSNNTNSGDSNIDFSDLLKLKNDIEQLKSNLESSEKKSFEKDLPPPAVLGESVNATNITNTTNSFEKKLKVEPYHTTVLARKIPMDPDFFIPQGTYIRCVMETLVMSDVDGPVSCFVPENIRSFNGVNILIPKGSRILGTYEQTKFTEERVPMTWNRIITPDNIDIGLNSIGISNLGAVGMPGNIDKRWGERLFNATLISLGLDAFAWKVVDRLPKKNKQTIINGSVINEEVDFDSVTYNNLKKFTDSELTRTLALPYRLVINQGTVGNIFVVRDMDFSTVYSN